MPYVKKLPDGRIATIESLITGARICVGRAGSWAADVYDDAYDYAAVELTVGEVAGAHARALRALEEWDGEGEPEGWYRHRPSNRRRPDGDPEKEYVAP